MKKFLATLTIFSVIFTSFAAFLVRPAHAQLVGPWYDQTPIQWFTKVYEDSNPQEIFGERYTAAQVQWIFYSLVSIVPVPKRIIACAMTFDFTGCGEEMWRMFTFNLADATPMTERSIAERFDDVSRTMVAVVTEDRPLSGVGHLRTSIANAGVPSAYAQDTQGTGFRGLTSVRSLWQASRDVTYVLMVLVIIAMAFMIMFRMQLPSRTVISVQSSLWSVFTALILITFSYAIAGFAIDIMYISLGLVSVIFTQTGVLLGGPNGAFTIYTVLTQGPGSMGAIGFLLAYQQVFFTVLSFILFTPEGSGVSGILSVIGTFATMLPRVSIAFIVSIILMIILFFMFFQIMWMLVKTFVNILLLTITGPFQILIGAAYPGTGGFKGWFMNLITNLAVYPVVGVLFLMAYIFLSGAFYADQQNWAQALTGVANIFDIFNRDTGFQIGFFGFAVNSDLFASASSPNTWTPPLTFGGFVSWLWLFASFVCVSMTPKTVELVQSFMSGKQFAYGSALGQSVAPIAGTAASGLALGKGFARQAGQGFLVGSGIMGGAGNWGESLGKTLSSVGRGKGNKSSSAPGS